MVLSELPGQKRTVERRTFGTDFPALERTVVPVLRVIIVVVLGSALTERHASQLD
jgi:hypothetical protein